jgi:hypothetical protein
MIKKLSRNKIIKIYHRVSGLSYKECRSNLKKIGWDIYRLEPFYNAIGKALDEANKVIFCIAEALGEAIAETAKVVREAFGEMAEILSDIAYPFDEEANNG